MGQGPLSRGCRTALGGITTSVTQPASPLDSPICAVDGNPSHGEHSELSLGEQIPSELFDIILFYIVENCTFNRDSSRSIRTSKLLRRGRVARAADNSHTATLQACSLVCHFWSVRCRRSLFSGATLTISTSEDMEIFKQCVTQGSSSPRLLPMYRLIGGIFIVQSYNDTQSFCHRLHALIPSIGQSLFEELFLIGPVPDHFPRYLLSTPHWSIPSTIGTPSSLLPFRCTNILDVHLPSFRHVSKYIRHLSSAAYVRFDKLTWGTLGTTIEHTIPHSYGIRRHGPDNVSISSRDCTDNMQLCLHTTLTRPDCPLHALQDDEYHRVVWLIGRLWQLRHDTDHSCYMVHWDSDSGDYCITMGLHSKSQCQFTFQLSFDNLTLDNAPGPTPDIHLSGFRAIFYVFKTGIDIHAVVELLRSYPTLRVIHFDFVDSSHVEETMSRLSWPELLAPPFRDCEYVLTPANWDAPDLELPAITIDPLILDPTGRSWENTDDIVSYLLQHPRSQRAIQRANDKRMSWRFEDLEAERAMHIAKRMSER